jgi:hypothetical protein
LENEVSAEELAPVVADDVKPVSNIPEVTAAEGEVEKVEQVEKTFTQAEVDALIQRRLVKEARRQARTAEQTARERVAANEPKRESFQDEEAFSEAKVLHLAEVKARQIVENRSRAEQAEKADEAYHERAEQARERYVDFVAVVENPLLPISESMAEFIKDSDIGPDVAYYLGKNPAKAQQIAQLSPVRAARELSRIEAEIASKPKANPSKAPEPITPVGTRGKAASSPLPSDDDDTETWMRKERERMSKRR